MYKVKCFSLIDKYQQTHWPMEMAARPIKGDKVRAENGAELKVVAITHRTGSDGPYMQVELHN